jgi:glucose/arabinose dehydrogenase
MVALSALIVTAAACDGDDGGDPPAATTMTASATRTPVAASSIPAGTPTSGPTGPATTAPPPPPQGVVAENYEPIRAFPQAAFPRMVALVPFPDDPSHAAVATQHEGVIYRVSLTDDAEAPTVFLDLSDVLIENAGNEEGLLGLAFSPDYATDRRLYVAYSAGGPRRNTVARYTAAGASADPASGRVLLEVEDFAQNHNGGAIAFGPDGYLYVAIGDGGGAGDPQDNGQKLTTLLGKILRLDVSGESYAVPPDNPFVGSGAGEIWAYGLRNPWRFTFDRQTGDLWVGDVGQGSWEEIDLVVRGGNYGWDTVEGPDCFDEDNCDRTGLTAPRVSYRTREMSTCAVTGGYVYRGTAMPELAGWYIYGDFCSGHVWAFDTDDASSQPVLLMDTDHSISSFAEDAAGEVYLVTFSEAIFRIARR